MDVSEEFLPQVCSVNLCLSLQPAGVQISDTPASLLPPTHVSQDLKISLLPPSAVPHTFYCSCLFSCWRALSGTERVVAQWVWMCCSTFPQPSSVSWMPSDQVGQWAVGSSDPCHIYFKLLWSQDAFSCFPCTDWKDLGNFVPK